MLKFVLLSLRYVFVEFASAEAAKGALSKAAELKVDQKPIKAELCSQRTTNEGPWPAPESYKLTDFKLNQLHVACLPRVTTDDDIKGIFPNATKIDLPHAGPGKTLG